MRFLARLAAIKEAIARKQPPDEIRLTMEHFHRILGPSIGKAHILSRPASSAMVSMG
jgi:hypothetical protein